MWVDHGHALDTAFADVGSAGDHRDMAGGEVPHGVVADAASDNEQLVALVEQIVAARLIAGRNLYRPRVRLIGSLVAATEAGSMVV